MLYYIILYYTVLYYSYLLFEAGACHVTCFFKNVVKRKWARGGGLTQNLRYSKSFLCNRFVVHMTV